jgi:membrane associated rhomboid family serine protease
MLSSSFSLGLPSDLMMDVKPTSLAGVSILVLVHLAYRAAPWLCSWLCLIPGHTFGGMVWNLLTSAFLERSPVGLVISASAFALFGHIFEPRWGQRETLRFVLVCAIASALGSCVAVMAMYAATRSETILFAELSGLSGVVAGIAVAIHQAAHSESHGLAAARPVSWLVGESHKVAMLYLLIHACWCLLTGHSLDILLAVHGLIASWVYLRFYQPHHSELSAGAAWGDASETFAFASIFFSALQPAVASLSRLTWSIVQVLVPPSFVEKRGRGVEEASSPSAEHLPGSNAGLAEQRRARALRQLDERMASATGRSPLKGAGGSATQLVVESSV